MKSWLDPDIPQTFYVLMAGRFLNLVGNSLVFPFMTLYLAHRLHEPMSLIGMVMTLYGLAQVSAQLVGGVLSDSWGRRKVMILSLCLGPLCTLAVGLSPSPTLLIVSLVLMGLTVPLFQPASMAMVGDLVPKAKLSQAYSLMRMASNAGIIIGPMLGGFLADHSYFAIFGFDALSMVLFLGIVLWRIPETGQSGHRTYRDRPSGSLGDVVRDTRFAHFAVLWGLISMVYSQLYVVVPAYLHLDLHYPPSLFGYLAAENALFVVTLQMPIAKLLRKLSPAPMMALGALCYGGGFACMLLGHRIAVFAVAVFIITLGENVLNPAASTWVATRAPEDLRGRYMGLFGLANRTGSAVGPTVGGSLLSWEPSVWLVAAGLIGLVISGAFVQFGRQERALPPERLTVSG